MTRLTPNGNINSVCPARPRRAANRVVAAALAAVEGLEQRLLYSTSVPAFQPPVQISAGTSAVALTSGDFDGDSNEDIAVANSSANTVSILSGNGDGSFSKSASYSVGAGPTAIATGDFNDDGYDDIVTANSASGTVSVLLSKVDADGNQTGSFTTAKTFHVEAGGSGPMSVVVDDFNNDGEDDIAVSSAGGLFLLSGNGDGTFSHPAQISGDALAGIVSGDFNDDGNEDLAVTNPTAGTVENFAGNGDGTFAAPTSTSVASGVTGITTGDFNSDGVTDLAVTVPGQNQVDVLLGNVTTVTVSEPTPGPIPIDPPVPLPPIAEPLGAGSATASTGIVGVVSGGTGSIGGTGTIIGGTGDFTYSIGTGTFAAPTTIPVSGASASITVDDVNGDGIDDVVVANTSGNAVTVVPGKGDGTFGSPVDIPMAAAPSAVITDDFNSDAGIDLATANSDGTVRVTLQQSADVGVTLSSSAPVATFGSNLTYTAVITNNGPGAAADVTFSDWLPDGATIVSATTTSGTVDTTSDSGAADVSLGDLASGASATVTIVVKPNSFETLSNSASVDSDSIDSSYENNYANVNIPVAGSSGAEVVLSADPGSYFAQVGQNITDSFNITNNGPEAASGLAFTDTLPAGVTYVSSSSTQGTITGSSDTQVTASLGDLAAGASATVSITFKASSTGELSDTATVAAADPSTDPFAPDNSATATTYVYDHKFFPPIPIHPIPVFGGVAKGGLYTLSNTSSGAASKAAGPAGAAPTIAISNVKKADVKKGTTAFTFTVTRSGNLNSASSVRYQTVDGSAKSGVAYQATSGQLSFAAGVAQQTVTVEVNGTKAKMPTQKFVVALTGAQNAKLKDSRATGTILGTAKAAGAKRVSKPKSPRTSTVASFNIKFEPAGAPAVKGFGSDTGLLYGDRGNSMTFGWSSVNTANAISRTGVKDPRIASFNVIGSPGASAWQIALPNGRYSVQIAAGDSTITSGTDAVAANGTLVLNKAVKKNHPFVTATAKVTVTDGVLTLSDASSTPVPLDFIKIKATR